MFTMEHFFYAILALIGGFLTLKVFGALFSIATVILIVLIPVAIYAYRRNGGNVINAYEWLKAKVLELKSKVTK